LEEEEKDKDQIIKPNGEEAPSEYIRRKDEEAERGYNPDSMTRLASGKSTNTNKENRNTSNQP
jgi:hypothetical protein